MTGSRPGSAGSSRCSPCTPVTARGKSTAAFGLALRAWNAGWPIGVFQFTKSPKWKSGEEDALKALGHLHEQSGQGGPVTWHKMGEGWSWLRTRAEDHAAAAQEGWAQVERDLAAETYRLLVLDEFTYPLANGTLDLDRVLATMQSRNRHPAHRHHRSPAPGKLCAAADLVTEMTKVKHPMDAGRKGQLGIEW